MEEGIANLFLVSRTTSKLKGQVEKRITKKKGIAAATGAHDKQKQKFFDAIVQSLILHFSSSPSWASMLKTVIIASPGFTKDGFYQHLKSASESSHHLKGGVGSFLKHCIEKSIIAHSSSGFKHSL
jgi:stalled ribosome rescue protein Dom34